LHKKYIPKLQSWGSAQQEGFPAYVVQDGFISLKVSERIKNNLSVLQIRDVYPGSRILILTIPDLGSRIQKQQQKRGMKKKFWSDLFL
jgi:hypothetical protein